jgi:predicted metal-dependent phosphoesterase TrpH
MHVHSYFSGPSTTLFLGSFCRESYSDPQEVYEGLQRRRMNLFTLTDHDSIEGTERLRRHENFFLSEELTCRMPSGNEVHIGVYDIEERQHEQLQRRRNDLVALLMYLTERKIFFTVNHVFSRLTGPREREDFAWFREYFPGIETRNGHMPENSNALAASLAERWEKIPVGGSDAHSLASVGTAYTEVPGARNKDEFFAGLKSGRGCVAGESGSFGKLTRDAFLIAVEMMREKNWTAVIAPLAALVPAVAYWNSRAEDAFSRHWGSQILGPSQPERRPRWISISPHAAEESA